MHSVTHKQRPLVVYLFAVMLCKSLLPIRYASVANGHPKQTANFMVQKFVDKVLFGSGVVGCGSWVAGGLEAPKSLLRSVCSAQQRRIIR